MRQIKLGEFKEERRAAGGLEIFDEESGETFLVEPPELWPDEAATLALAGDNVGVARLVLGGSDVYDRFVTAGGTAALLGQMFQEAFGASPGESVRSSRS